MKEAGRVRPPGFVSRGGSWVWLLLACSLPVSLFGMQAGAITGACLLLAWLVAVVYSGHGSAGSGMAVPPKTGLELPIGFWLLTIAFSLILAPGPVTSLRGATSFWPVIAFFSSACLLADLITLRRAVWLMICLASAVAAFGVFQSLTGSYPGGQLIHSGMGQLLKPAPGGSGYFGAVGLFFSRLTFAHMLLFPLCWTVGLLFNARSKKQGIVLALLCLVLLGGLAATFTRAALVAAGAACLLIVVWHLRSGWPRWITLGGLLAGGALVLLLVPGLATRVNQSFSGKKDWGRLAIWHSAFDLAAQNPLTGIGYGKFQKAAVEHVDGRRKDVGARVFRGTFAWAHSNLLTFMAEAGALGVLAFCWLFVAYFRAVIRRLGALAKAPPLARGFVRGSVAAVCAFLIAGLFHDTFFDGEVVFCLWFTMGASLATLRLADGAGEGRE